jgi:hypothetical protein
VSAKSEGSDFLVIDIVRVSEGQPWLVERKRTATATRTERAPPPPVEQSASAVSLDDLDLDVCCEWPVSGKGRAMLFCGAASDGASSYCAHHHLRSVFHGAEPRRYVVTKPGRLMAAFSLL